MAHKRWGESNAEDDDDEQRESPRKPPTIRMDRKEEEVKGTATRSCCLWRKKVIFAPNGIHSANFHNLQFIIDTPGFFIVLDGVVKWLTDSGRPQIIITATKKRRSVQSSIRQFLLVSLGYIWAAITLAKWSEKWTRRRGWDQEETVGGSEGHHSPGEITSQ